ncbi:MAG: KpsF/GutQ family sugar-phosphate isomerase [Proteobacteria bacterium]|nr:KpsF/GutQ family sugar-phosphate isomerase [Pseudomonadota bacterium]
MSSSKAKTLKSAPATDLVSAARVLKLEADGINALSASLDGRFTAALDVLANVKGRVIVTGMGKSGHVARKIAATLASTGTPAYFVHPGEASHGDLGMIARDDAIIALSNSGNTRELYDLFEYAKRFAIPLIAITSGADSTMSDVADIAFILPPIPEGCPMGLAPTTSTTMALALGDAIAVALLERRGFSTTDFRVLHPGGQIGSSLQRVSDLMHTGDELPLAPEDAGMSDAVLAMTAKHFGCVGIIGQDGTLKGVVTDGDLRRHMSDSLLSRTAAEIMTVNPATIRAQALGAEALSLMNERAITSLFVTEDGHPVGILHIHDCLRAGIR